MSHFKFYSAGFSGGKVEIIPDFRSHNYNNFIIYRKYGDKIVISAQNLNLSSTPNGKVYFGPQHIKAWEKFNSKFVTM